MKKNTKEVPVETQISRQDGDVFLAKSVSRGAFHAARSNKIIPAQLPMSRIELAKRLSQFQMFKRVPKTVLKAVAKSALTKAYRRGDLLWRHGDSVSEITLIDSGFVKASRKGRNGANKTYGLFGPGDSMGLYAYWAGRLYPTDAIALNDGVNVITIDAGEMSSLSEQHPRLSKNMKDEVTCFSEVFIKKIEIISAGSVQQRFAVLLLQLVDRYGVDGQGEQVRLPVFLTQEQISEIIDARIETVARSVGQWRRAGWLNVDAQGWHFNRLDKLRELLDC